uniref:Uncharacterized protein n=1 Tax=Pyxicephalus adspersus TaxID=30357 RepID=A0AAV3AT45_PYXAD|nr:TPA: hypothetical protein GDO54_008574 [Pyxicephalus adspersus]
MIYAQLHIIFIVKVRPVTRDLTIGSDITLPRRVISKVDHIFLQLLGLCSECTVSYIRFQWVRHSLRNGIWRLWIHYVIMIIEDAYKHLQ